MLTDEHTHMYIHIEEEEEEDRRGRRKEKTCFIQDLQPSVRVQLI